MNAFKHRYSVALPLLFVVLALASCVRVELEVPDLNDADRYLTVRLNLPAMKEPSTRSMSYEDENKLDPDLLSVVIVKNDLVSMASLVGSVVYDEDDRSKATITVRLPESETEDDEIRLCVVANHAIIGELNTYDAFKAAQQIDVPDQWPTTQAIPMWGESEEFVVNDATATHTIDMYRSLARIDVGLSLASQDGELTETAAGLTNFTINSISIYNTATRMFVAPASIPPTSPNVPTGDRRPSDDPLIYGPLGGVDAYVREIYVPEADLPNPFATGDTHCVIVGGFYDGSATESFYRLEFATENTDGSATYLPLLRNHRYVFNITEIVGPGSGTPADAFNSVGAIANRIIAYELIVLDEFIHRVELEGGYYFGLDNRTLVFEPQSGISSTVHYQTDRPSTESILLEWSDPASGAARYSLTLDTGAKSFTVETISENISGEVYVDTLYVKAGSFSIPVVVRQKPLNLNYGINCGSVVVSGAYVMDEALGTTHKIALSITAEDASIQGEPYVIETEEFGGDHGISFHATGTFDFSGIPPGDPLVMDIELQGSGTLSGSAGSDPFKLRINTNSGLETYCEATIVPVEQPMNIVVMAPTDEPGGYSIDRLNGGAGQVFNHPNNFGPYDYSIVKAAGFIYINANSVYDFGLSPSTDIYKWVTGEDNNGKIADMIYIAYPAAFGATTAQLLVDYLEHGGVIVAFLQEASSVSYLMQEVFTGYNVTSSYTGYGGRIYPLAANPKLFADPDGEPRQAVLRQLEGDPILNGPFGDIREQQIGEDGEDSGVASSLSNFPTGSDYAETATVYAYSNDINASPNVTNSTLVMGFKLEEVGENGRNLFFWGDGGVMVSDYDASLNGIPHAEDSGYTICPFVWNTSTFFPIPRPVYGLTVANRMPVYNSTLLCNAMGWGVRKSYDLKARRLEFEQNFVGP